MNPFQLVYDALWDLVDANPAMAELVRLGNRIKFSGNDGVSPEKQVTSASDLPELALTSESSSANIHNTSSTTRITRTYAFQIVTGTLRLDESLMRVEWALFVALHGWKQVLCSLQWSGKNFVKRCDITSISNGHSDRAALRGINGWSAVWSIDVEMHFALADIKAILEGSSSGSP